MRSVAVAEPVLSAGVRHSVSVRREAGARTCDVRTVSVCVCKSMYADVIAVCVCRPVVCSNDIYDFEGFAIHRRHTQTHIKCANMIELNGLVWDYGNAQNAYMRACIAAVSGAFHIRLFCLFVCSGEGLLIVLLVWFQWQQIPAEVECQSGVRGRRLLHLHTHIPNR